MTKPVTITMLLDVKSEAIDPLCSALPEMLKDTKNFKECRSVRIMKHKTEKNLLIFLEEWDTEEDYHKYIAWRTERGDMDGFVQVLNAPPKIEMWPTLVAE